MERKTKKPYKSSNSGSKKLLNGSNDRGALAKKHVQQQLNFAKSEIGLKSGKPRSHGGAESLGRRKTYRPLATKTSIHLVLRSSKARGSLSFLRKENDQLVRGIIHRTAKKYFVCILRLANVGNHLHLEVRISAKQEFHNFLRVITSQIARKITGARRGFKFGKFWDHLAFTRVLSSARELFFLRNYIMANKIEGALGREARAYFQDFWYKPILI